MVVVSARRRTNRMTRMQRAGTFNDVAVLYHTQRVGYVDALFDDLQTIADLQPGARVLEIGCGTGQATLGLAARGWDVTAIDPGPALIDLARRTCADLPNVRFSLGRFEDWPLDPHPFRLVAAAQSWHWVDADVRFTKAAQALAPSGHLAVFGHTPLWSAELRARLDPIYRSLTDATWMQPPEIWYMPEGPICGLFAASGRFAPAQHKAYVWTRSYTPQSFVAYLATRSDHNRLPQDRRAQLLADVEKVLPETLEADWVTNLYIAALARSPSSEASLPP
jgi:SAM-dependent methyltransferase